MRLVTNSVAPTKVEQTEFGWRINDVPIVKAMNLSGGYVPEWSIKETASDWSGTPPTLNHPRNNKGEPIAANRKPELQLGENENARYDGEFARVDITVNEADLVNLGGEALDIRDALENGNPIQVSSQYVPKELPPGEYDGEYRENVEAIAEPDSVALLPNQRGRCDLSDGCGINPQMVANAGVSLTATSDDAMGPSGGQAEAGSDTQTMQGNQLSKARTPEFDGTTTGEWSKPDFSEYVDAFGYDAEAVSDLSADQRQAIAETTLLGDPEAETFENLQFFPVVEPDSMNLSENALMAVLSGRGAQADIPSGALESSRSVARRLLEEEFDRDMSDNSAFNQVLTGLKAAFGFGGEQNGNDAGGNSGVDTANSSDEFESAPTNTMDRDKLIDDITANSALTEAALAERCDDGLEAIHSDIMANTDDDPDGGGEEYVELTEEEFMQRVDERAEKKAEEMVANMEEESEKEDLASDIVANSAEYEDTETVRKKFPTVEALESKLENLNTGATMPGTGATANTAFEDDDMDEISGGVF